MMPNEDVCPSPNELMRWQLGLVEDNFAAVDRHIAECARCLLVLNTTPGRDQLVDALRTGVGKVEGNTPTEIEAIVPWLKRLRLPDETHSYTPTSPPNSVDDESPISFDFLAPPESPGELGRLGPYRILRILGVGGMGLVFEAEDPKLCRRVAIKVIKPELFQRPGLRQQFLREAQTIASLDHDQIVAIYQVDEANGVPYLAMPLLRGESLETFLHRHDGPVPLESLLRIGREIASGLVAAHSLGLVHRDIKPSNLWLETKEGTSTSNESGQFRVKILDFGLAQSKESLSQGEVTGTPAYMSPEQCKGEGVDARSDLFSLGCVLYRMATGRHPFRRGPDLLTTLWHLAVETPTSARTLNRNIPQALSVLIDRMLAKSADNRPESADAVVKELQRIERNLKPRWHVPVFMLVLGLSLALGLTWWWNAPVTVTFDYDEPAAKIVVEGADGRSQVLDLAEKLTWHLAPGTYRVRLETPVKERQLDPPIFAVAARTPLTQPFRLVGEISSQYHTLSVTDVAMARNVGSSLAVSTSRDQRLGVWDISQGKAAFLEGQPSQLLCVAISTDAKLVATGAGMKHRNPQSGLGIWNLETKTLLHLIPTTSWVTSAAFSPANNEQLIAGLADGSVTVWELNPPKIARTLRGHDTQEITRVVFRPDGASAFSAGRDGKIVHWDLATGKQLQVFEGHGEAVKSIAVAPNGDLLGSCGFDGTIRKWNILTGEGSTPIKTEKALHSLAWSPDGKRWLSGGADGAVRLWNVADGREISSFHGQHKAPVNGVAFSADSRRALSGGADGVVKLWELPR